jgi:hypothetical protein
VLALPDRPRRALCAAIAGWPQSRVAALEGVTRQGLDLRRKKAQEMLALKSSCRKPEGADEGLNREEHQR